VRTDLAMLHEQEGRPAQALDVRRPGLDLEPVSTDAKRVAVRLAASLLERTGKASEAEALLRRHGMR